MPEHISYLSRFKDQAAVVAYENKEYGVASYSSFVWQWQCPWVLQIIKDHLRQRNTPTRLLDFACGTGRVLSCVETLADDAEGIDISENMVAMGRSKCRKARFKVGDILGEPGLLSGKYDVITVFRFLLNVEPPLRQAVLRKLRAVLRPDGLLLVNVHGNSRSLRHPAIVWRRWRERSQPTAAMLNEMSPRETVTLLENSGFRIVKQLGFGVLPPSLYRTPLRNAAQRVDGALAGDRIWRNYTIDMMFACRPC
jgi:SAM-dependent methyltransferase